MTEIARRLRANPWNERLWREWIDHYLPNFSFSHPLIRFPSGLSDDMEMIHQDVKGLVESAMVEVERNETLMRSLRWREEVRWRVLRNVLGKFGSRARFAKGRLIACN